MARLEREPAHLATSFLSSCRPLDEAFAPVAGEAEIRGLDHLGMPEIGEGGDVRRTVPVRLPVGIDGPPAGVPRRELPVDFRHLPQPQF